MPKSKQTTHDSGRLAGEKVLGNVLPLRSQQVCDGQTPAPGDAPHPPVPDGRRSAALHVQLARHLRWSAQIGDDGRVWMFFLAHERTSQHFVEKVNAALLRERISQNPHDAAMNNAKPPSKAREQFGRRLAAIREAAGYDTQTEFATLLKMSVQRYSRYERGETEPNLETLQEIQRITGVSLDFLVGGQVPGARLPANEPAPALPPPAKQLAKD